MPGEAIVTVVGRWWTEWLAGRGRYRYLGSNSGSHNGTNRDHPPLPNTLNTFSLPDQGPWVPVQVGEVT